MILPVDSRVRLALDEAVTVALDGLRRLGEDDPTLGGLRLP